MQKPHGRPFASSAAQKTPQLHRELSCHSPQKPDEILLSGELAGGQSLTNRALVVDQPIGQGHIVMFALRPFWRWQTQGTFALGFNTILNWDHLDAGKKETKPKPASGN